MFTYDNTHWHSAHPPDWTSAWKQTKHCIRSMMFDQTEIWLNQINHTNILTVTYSQGSNWGGMQGMAPQGRPWSKQMTKKHPLCKTTIPLTVTYSSVCPPTTQPIIIVITRPHLISPEPQSSAPAPHLILITPTFISTSTRALPRPVSFRHHWTHSSIPYLAFTLLYDY